MDELDMKIIRELERNSRLSNTQLASKLKVSEGTVRKRVQKLVKEGTIKRFTVELTTKSGFTAFTLITTDPSASSTKLITDLKKVVGVKRVFDLAGNIDFMAELSTLSPEEFNAAVDIIRKVPAVKNTESLIVLRVS